MCVKDQSFYVSSMTSVQLLIFDNLTNNTYKGNLVQLIEIDIRNTVDL